MVGIAEACPPADMCSGRGPTETSGRRPRRKRWEGPKWAKRTESSAITAILPAKYINEKRVTNHFRKCAEFVKWLNEKTEGWDSQPFGSVFALTSDTPISSVMTADFLYPTKAKTRVRPHLDKHRVNHLDSHPDLSAMSSTNHKVNILQW